MDAELGVTPMWCWGRSADNNECAQDSLPSKLWPGRLLYLHFALSFSSICQDS